MAWTALATLAGGILSAKAAGDAADAQQEAADAQTQLGYDQLALQEEIYNNAVALLQPYVDAGTNALTDYTSVVGDATSFQNAFDSYLGDFEASPDYQFRLDQGNAALEAAQNASGKYYSGSTGQALVDYNQAAASQEYSDWYDRGSNEFYNWLTGLSGLTTTGQNAAAGTAAAGTSYGSGSSDAYNDIANALASYADASAAGSVGTANAWTNSINDALSIWGYMNNGSSSSTTGSGGTTTNLLDLAQSAAAAL